MIFLIFFFLHIQNSIVPKGANGIVGANIISRKEDLLVLRFTPETVALVLDLQFACLSTKYCTMYLDSVVRQVPWGLATKYLHGFCRARTGPHVVYLQVLHISVRPIDPTFFEPSSVPSSTFVAVSYRLQIFDPSNISCRLIPVRI